jgi:hypothetical protein
MILIISHSGGEKSDGLFELEDPLKIEGVMEKANDRRSAILTPSPLIK